MNRVLGAVGLALAALGAAPGQDRAAAAYDEELRLHQAIQDGTAPTLILDLAASLCARFPERPYPRAVFGDTLFRMRRLQAAADAYRAALERMARSERNSPLGLGVAANLEKVELQIAEYAAGLRQERRARLAGWLSLAALLGLAGGLALRIRRSA